MIEEMDALTKNDTWYLVRSPVGKKAIDFRWVFTVKVNLDGLLLLKGMPRLMGWIIMIPFPRLPS